MWLLLIFLSIFNSGLLDLPGDFSLVDESNLDVIFNFESISCYFELSLPVAGYVESYEFIILIPLLLKLIWWTYVKASCYNWVSLAVCIWIIWLAFSFDFRTFSLTVGAASLLDLTILFLGGDALLFWWKSFFLYGNSYGMTTTFYAFFYL